MNVFKDKSIRDNASKDVNKMINDNINNIENIIFEELPKEMLRMDMLLKNLNNNSYKHDFKLETENLLQMLNDSKYITDIFLKHEPFFKRIYDITRIMDTIYLWNLSNNMKTSLNNEYSIEVQLTLKKDINTFIVSLEKLLENMKFYSCGRAELLLKFNESKFLDYGISVMKLDVEYDYNIKNYATEILNNMIFIYNFITNNINYLCNINPDANV